MSDNTWSLETELPGPAPLLVNARDAAKLLGLAMRSFERMLRLGRVPAPVTRFGTSRRWSVEALQSFVERGCVVEEPIATPSRRRRRRRNTA